MSTFCIFFEAMGGRCEIRLAAVHESAAHRLAQFAIDEVNRIETKYSRYRPDSVLSQIAARAGNDWTVCDDETQALLDYANTLFVRSDGLFDITSGVLRRAWNFRRAELPTEEALRILCGLVNWSSVQRDGRRIRLPQAGMELDFGGFGKEYAADRAASALVEQGIKHGYVNLAGDIRVIGPQTQGQPWRIGIQNPQLCDGLIASIEVTSGAVATSGDYERSFVYDGRRFCHILHPHSGRPVNFWRSVSVLAPSALEAGSFSTIAMLKEEQGLAFLERDNVIYIAVDQAGALHCSQTN